MKAPATHTELNGCEYIDGLMHWKAHCSCGWSGEARGGSADTKLAHEDYRRHVVGELGEAAHYAAAVVCVNCGYRGEAQLVIGTDGWSGTCPMCNCRGRLRPEELHDERRARGEVS